MVDDVSKKEQTQRPIRVGSTTDIAKELGVSSGTVHNWSAHPEFPPASIVGGSRAWEIDAVRAWCLRYRKGPGRKPTAPHGSRARYKNCTTGPAGSKCDRCKRANARYMRERYAQRKEETR